MTRRKTLRALAPIIVAAVAANEGSLDLTGRLNETYVPRRAGAEFERRAFAQELRVGADGEITLWPKLLKSPLDFAAGADRHRRLGGDDGKSAQMWRHLLDRREDVGEIGMTVAAAHWCADLLYSFI